jgi:hypothetical protein
MNPAAPVTNVVIPAWPGIWPVWSANALATTDSTRTRPVRRPYRLGYRALHDKFAFVYALVPLAAAAVLKGDDAWAARILGARDAVTERTGTTVADKSVHDLRERAEREARTRLGPDRWARAYAAGRVTSIDSLMKEIDSVLRGRVVSRAVPST